MTRRTLRFAWLTLAVACTQAQEAPQTSTITRPLDTGTTVITTTPEFGLGGNVETSVDIASDQITHARTARGLPGWNVTRSLGVGGSVPRQGHGAVTYNGYLYVVGGKGLATVDVAKINSSGSLAAWAATKPLPSARERAGVVAYNGYLYVIGGENDTSFFTDVLAAKIGPDGLLGNWAPTTALPTARSRLALTAYRDRLYAVGGWNGANLAEAWVADLHGDGTVGNWAAVSALAARSALTVAQHDGYLFAAGGITATGKTTDVSVALVNKTDGTLGAWAATTALPAARTDHSSAVVGDALYVTGGATDSGNLDETLVAPLGPNGVLGAWAKTASFALARRVHGLTVSGTNLYLVGGETSGAATDDVELAAVRADGTVGAWENRGTLTTARFGHTAEAYNGYAYIIGGRSGGTPIDGVWGATIATVAISPIGAGGALTGPWTFAPLPAGFSAHMSAIVNGYLYIVGGLTSPGSYTGQTYYARIKPNGGIDSFATTSDHSSYWESFVAYNGYLYSFFYYTYGVKPNPDGSLGGWGYNISSTGYTNNRSCGVGYNGYLYMLGGSNSGARTEILRSKIGAGGGLIGWTKIGDLPQGRYDHTCHASNGYLYVVGGRDATGVRDDVIATRINLDGGLDTNWITMATGPGKREDHASFIYGGQLYVVGGWDGTSILGDVTAVQLTIPTTGTASFAATSAIKTNGREQHASALSGNHVYVIGGARGVSMLPDVQVATIQPGGALGAFATTEPLDEARKGLASVAYNGHLYAVAGESGLSGILSDVWVASIQSDGTIAPPWVKTRDFGASLARSGHAAVAAFGHLYVLGGYNGSGQFADVQIATIAADGAVGAFAASPTPFATTRFGHAAVVYGNYLYVHGGCKIAPAPCAAANVLDDLQAIPINTDGTLGTHLVDGSTIGWATVSSPGPRYEHSLVGADGYLYVVGGLDANGNALDDVQMAAVHTDGTLGRWEPAGRFATARSGQTAVAAHGNLYVLGGNASGTYLTDVQAATLLAPRAVGEYSRNVDFGFVASSVDTVLMNGLAANPGIAGLSYRAADESGVFGAPVEISPATLGATLTVGKTKVRYLWLDVLLDDGFAASAHPAATNRRDVTDITIGYTYPCLGVVCTAKDQCHVAGICDPATGVCSDPAISDGTTCSDGSACTTVDTCVTGACVGSSPVVCAATDGCHLAGVCAPSTGLCSNPIIANGTECEDGTKCTTGTICLDGACGHPTTTKTCPVPDQCHEPGTCDPSTGDCSNPAKTDGTGCTDGTLCTSGEACHAGVCGAPTVTTICTAIDTCHAAGSCDPATGACSTPKLADSTACDDGTACTSGTTCTGGVCGNPATTKVCGALDGCHVAGTCDAATGLCSDPPIANDTSCEDGNACTSGESCQEGLCKFPTTTKTCLPPDQCHVAGACVPATGDCAYPPIADGTECNDANACTTGEACHAGVCGAPTITTLCAAIDTCHAAGTCDTATGECSHPVLDDGSTCEDGDKCSNGETCAAGVCGSPLTHTSCTRFDACHVAGSCDPATGLCSNPAALDGTTCATGAKCVRDEACTAGVCGTGRPVDCVPLDDCHLAGTCDLATGLCSNPFAPAAVTACDDHDMCTSGDNCDESGACTRFIERTGCTPEPCHYASCVPATGECQQTPTPNGTSCGDGKLCADGVCGGADAGVDAAADAGDGGPTTVVDASADATTPDSAADASFDSVGVAHPDAHPSTGVVGYSCQCRTARSPLTTGAPIAGTAWALALAWTRARARRRT